MSGQCIGQLGSGVIFFSSSLLLTSSALDVCFVSMCLCKHMCACVGEVMHALMSVQNAAELPIDPLRILSSTHKNHRPKMMGL